MPSHMESQKWQRRGQAWDEQHKYHATLSINDYCYASLKGTKEKGIFIIT